MGGKVQSLEERVLIFAPTGNEAANAADVLAKEGIESRICRDIPDLCSHAREGTGALLITQETLTARCIKHIAALLEEQQPWSDIPVVLLATGGETIGRGMITFRALGSSSTITVLERPLRVVSLVSAIKTGLRARRRQYQVRDLLQQREAITRELGERARSLEHSQRELLEAKEKISLHADELEKVVAERTAKLRETIAQLEAFSYSISHDMRGPLRAMQQYSEIVLEECGALLPQDAGDYLGRICRAAKRLDRLIQDVLTYSRVARTAMPLVPIDLNKLLGEILEQYPIFKPPIAEVKVFEPLPKVLGHEASLTQCISNLLGNAVKFVPPGRRPEVRVRTGKANRAVQVWIEDNGIGIAPENHQRIFNIFERVHSDSEYEGTGIGLSIVKKTIERMGGEVGVESELGRGSRFWIQLPAANHE